MNNVIDFPKSLSLEDVICTLPTNTQLRVVRHDFPDGSRYLLEYSLSPGVYQSILVRDTFTKDYS